MITKGTVSFPVITLSGLTELPTPYVDNVSADLIYQGYAPLGTAEDDPAWLVIQITVVGTVTKTKYANGSAKFNQKWSDRATLNYAR